MTISTKFIMLTVIGVMAGKGAPLCTTQTYTVYLALGSAGCSLGNETFSNFGNPSFTTSLGVPTLSNSQILVTPTLSGNSEMLAFSYETTTGAPLLISLSDNSQAFAFSFSYLALATTSLSSIQMESTFSNTTPGSVSATKNAQAVAGGTIFTSAVTDGGISNMANTYLGPVTPITGGTAPFNVQDAISLQAQSGSVMDGGFANAFVTSSGVTTTAPEPSESILIGSGILLISLFMRKLTGRNERIDV
jgi:hypothetical protein